MVEPISTCQIDTNKVTWHCLSFPWSLPISHWIIKARIIENEKRVKKLPQWVTILFGLLLNGFWSKSHDPGFVLKPRCHSSLYNHTRSSAHVSSSYHINLSKMSKHWGSFLSHCKGEHPKKKSKKVKIWQNNWAHCWPTMSKGIGRQWAWWWDRGQYDKYPSMLAKWPAGSEKI